IHADDTTIPPTSTDAQAPPSTATSQAAVHKRLDAFELRVIERPATNIDVTTFQTGLTRIRSDVDALLTPAEVVRDTAPEVEEDEVVMSALFGDTMPPPNPSRAAGKCYHSSEHNADTDEARRSRKKEWHELVTA
ncbi:hypothetical protein MTR67_040117, partial [Solanum verrucosum]